MRYLISAAIAAVAFCHVSAVAQETAPGLVSTYEALADTILSVKRAEAGLVQALLESHFSAASAAFEQRDYAVAAAHMSLFANEGDNAIAGVRKRLVEGGHHHHHHASDVDDDEYDQGFVVVNKAHKASLLAAAAQMRQAKRKSDAKDAWQRFETTAGALLTSE